MSDIDLNGKVIIVTGGTGILGKSFVSGIGDAGGKAISLRADVTVEEDLVGVKNKVLMHLKKLMGW